jgi:hypothetical protein
MRKLFLAATLAALGCSSGSSMNCVPGSQTQCACGNGVMGFQICNVSGTGVGPCQACAIADMNTTNADLAMKQLANTGDPCAKSTDCGGNSPSCLVKDSSGLMWPLGYCTSKCNPQKNDPNTYTNTACPGNGTCIGNGTSGSCYTYCTSKSGGLPCRDQYLCFNWTMGDRYCGPAASSECDPSKTGTCPQDGGSIFVDDGGQSTYSGRVCERIGPDPVGQCADGCSVFLQNCNNDNSGNPQGCYASFETGEGLCSSPAPGGKDGAACIYLNGCDPGLGCHTEGNNYVCRPYCGGPNNVACNNGKKCVVMSTSGTVPVAVVGMCGG